MSDFRVGEIVVCVVSAYHPEHVGQECVVVKPFGFYPTRRHPEGTWGITVQYQGEPVTIVGEPGKYRRKEPPKQREELGEWDLCPWRPEKQPVSEEASR